MVKMTAKKIKLKRIEKEISTEKLSKMVGISRVSLYGYESGKKFPRPTIIGKIAEVLDCEIKDLID